MKEFLFGWGLIVGGVLAALFLSSAWMCLGFVGLAYLGSGISLHASDKLEERINRHDNN